MRFIRPYLDRDLGGGYAANGTGGRVLSVDVAHGELVVGCDDGRPITLRPAALEKAQPLRLGYASHALKLQGGQAAVVLVLPWGWQTSRQAAYSMVTAVLRRCMCSLTWRPRRLVLTGTPTRSRPWVNARRETPGSAPRPLSASNGSGSAGQLGG